MDNELVEYYFNAFKDKIEKRKDNYVYSNIDLNNYYSMIKKYVAEIVSKNRQNVLTSSFIDYLLFPPKELQATLENLCSDDEDKFFNVIYNFIIKPYGDYISGNHKEYFLYMEHPDVNELKKLKVKATKSALSIVSRIGFNIQEQIIILTIIFGVLTECFIEQKLTVYDDYLDKLLKDPHSYIDDIKLTDLYNKGDLNRRLTSKRILEVFENTRREIL